VSVELVLHYLVSPSFIRGAGMTLLLTVTSLFFGVVIGLALALIILIFANQNGSTSLTKLGGAVVFMFAALGAYIWLSVADQSLGGSGYPMGRALRS